MNNSSDSPSPEQADSPAPTDFIVPDSVEDTEEQGTTAIAEFSASWSWNAPLPPPGVLREYESLLPGATKRLFDRYEEQVDHRMQVEREMMPTIRKARLRGQWMAYTLALAAMALSGVLAVLDNGVVAILVAGLVIISIASLAGVFITGRWRRQGRAGATDERNLSDPTT